MPGGRSPWWGALAKRLPLGRAAEEVTGKSARTGARGVRSGEYRVGRDSEVGPRGAAKGRRAALRPFTPHFTEEEMESQVLSYLPSPLGSGGAMTQASGPHGAWAVAPFPCGVHPRSPSRH